MKLYSISRYPDPANFVDVNDLSIVANAEELRALAAFFARAADLVSEQANPLSSSWHLHLRDEWPRWDECLSDVIVSLDAEGKSD